MWFKNLHIYRLHQTADIDAGELAERLESLALRPLGDGEPRRMGWSAPAGRRSQQMLHELNGHRLMTAVRQERILPASVVNDEVAERVEAIESQTGLPMHRQEKLAIKEQVFEELLPRAFVRRQQADVWWDTERQLIAINTGSRKRAEEVLDLLRETLGSLKVTPLATNTLPIRAMTAWVTDPGKRPAGMLMGDQVELKTKGDDGVVRGRQVDLDSDDMQQLLDAGRQASKLALRIEGRLRFVLHDDLTLKQLHFDDALIDEAHEADDGDDPVARLETDFLLMAQALGASIELLIEWLGGEASSDAGPAPESTEPSSDETGDALLADARDFVVASRKTSISAIQRHFKIGYHRAARLIEDLELLDVVSPMGSSGSRKVLTKVAL